MRNGQVGLVVFALLAVVGGLTSSTVLSLFLVPVMFMFFATRTPKDAEEPAPHRHVAGVPA